MRENYGSNYATNTSIYKGKLVFEKCLKIVIIIETIYAHYTADSIIIIVTFNVNYIVT